MPRIEDDVKLDFKDVLIRPKRSTLRSRSEVSLEREMKFKWSGRTLSCVPILAANMDTVGTFEMAKAFAAQKCVVCVHKHYTPEDWAAFYAESPEVFPYLAVSAGSSDTDAEKLNAIVTACPAVTIVCLDVANGYSEAFVEAVQRTRQHHPTLTIFAGNVVTPEMTEQLLLSGADVVKVGIGPGSVCTTRKQTGVGYPQLSAVLECAEAAHGLGGHVISDGGCTCPGDFSKAFGAGADFIMSGGMFAGHDESGGELVEKNGSWFKTFYGMSSSVAMKKHAGGVANYRSSEGKAITVPYRGPVSQTLQDILGGIRSSCTYVGAAKLEDLPMKTIFIRVSMQLNEVFGKTDDSKGGHVPPPEAAAAAKKARVD